MTLVVDNRVQLQQQNRPGLHAIIIGVSAYPMLPAQGEPDDPRTLGMHRLSSTSLAAFRFYEWLIQNQGGLPVPLSTCRILLSPSAEEVTATPQMSSIDSATLAGVKAALVDWRNDARPRQDNVSLFFFAGHGIERRKGDSVLILQDFGTPDAPLLENAVDLNEISDGMAPGPNQPEIARHQLYFVDSCRNLPPQVTQFDDLRTSVVFDKFLSGEDNRSAPVYFGAVPGTQAWATSDGTLFTSALLQCLRGDAADSEEVGSSEKWTVSVLRLAGALTRKAEGLKEKYKRDVLDYIATGPMKDLPISYLANPPTVPVTLIIDPDAALNAAQLNVLNDIGTSVQATVVREGPNRLKFSLEAGVYTIGVRFDAPTTFLDAPGRSRPVRPPEWQKRVLVSPQ